MHRPVVLVAGIALALAGTLWVGYAALVALALLVYSPSDAHYALTAAWAATPGVGLVAVGVDGLRSLSGRARPWSGS